MYCILFFLWIVFNAKISLEIILFGLVIVGAVYFFMCRFMNYSLKRDIALCKKAGIFIWFAITLLWEILKANGATIKMILSNRYETEPAIIKFQMDFKTKLARVMFANSITLTPGTITVELEDNIYTVHCLDKEFAKDITQGSIVKILKKLEENIA